MCKVQWIVLGDCLLQCSLERENGSLWMHLKMVVSSIFVEEAKTTLHGKHAI